jgi:hypothetical protein
MPDLDLIKQAEQEARDRLAQVSRRRASDRRRLPRRSGYTVGCQAPSTKKASLSPGQRGIVVPITVRGSCPSQRN